jgi:hypothetical protein
MSEANHLTPLPSPTNRSDVKRHSRNSLYSLKRTALNCPPTVRWFLNRTDSAPPPAHEKKTSREEGKEGNDNGSKEQGAVQAVGACATHTSKKNYRRSDEKGGERTLAVGQRTRHSTGSLGVSAKDELLVHQKHLIENALDF